MAEHLRFALADWEAEGARIFGPDRRKWRFECPSCGHVASAQEWRDAGAPEKAVAFACVGRWAGDPQKAADAAFRLAGGPCNYTGDGLVQINPVEVLIPGRPSWQVFAFERRIEIAR